MDLLAINASCSSPNKPSCRLQDLPQEETFKIVNCKLVQTRYGQTVLVELEEKVIFLPKRATTQLRNHLVELSSGNYGICYKGLEAATSSSFNPSPKFEFKKL
ncbi:uncharacterized protein LOC126886832 [Diabrotica virgifera virgifera]|uniref:Uncharacterized protein n=1 Tax=Diabrotica virgifera virgifera TaxID=50390 RepID=A0ABM5KI29_DIAVI|nr:uncharacterized protein LOC126886832 [Diabrotica virgifera virgifera]